MWNREIQFKLRRSVIWDVGRRSKRLWMDKESCILNVGSDLSLLTLRISRLNKPETKRTKNISRIIRNNKINNVLG